MLKVLSTIPTPKKHLSYTTELLLDKGTTIHRGRTFILEEDARQFEAGVLPTPYVWMVIQSTPTSGTGILCLNTGLYFQKHENQRWVEVQCELHVLALTRK